MSNQPEKIAVWLRHRDTGAVRGVTAKQWKDGEKDLRAEGYAPCAEDGSPLEA